MAQLNTPSVHAQWKSRITFILAATGSAVGLGNIWKFPYITGESGGGAFVLIYLICIVAMGIPVMMAETLLGRRGRSNPVSTMSILAKEAKTTQIWRYLGWMGVIAGILILSYYSVIAGKTIAYIFKIMTGLLWDLTPELAEGSVQSLNENVFALTLWHSVFMAATMYIVVQGVNEGIEKSVEFLMPALFIILLVLVLYSMTTGAFSQGLSFLFSPDWSALSGQTILIAMGQAFFTLSLGMGAIMVYGSYLPKGISIARTAAIVAFADTSVALLAGIAIFPLVFANGLEPASGPDLIFKTLPMAFSNMFGGTIFGLMFFVLLVFAALSSSISLIEPAISFLIEKMSITRQRACVLTGGLTWLLGMGTVFSTNIWAEMTLFGKTFFELVDYMTANLMLPIGGILMSVFAGWLMNQKNTAEELELPEDGIGYKTWRFLICYIAPSAVVLVLLNSLF